MAEREAGLSRESKAIAFVDCCGFTAYTDEFGDEAAVRMHMALRRAIDREAALARVEVVKWLGDGVMLAAADSRAILSCLYRTMLRARDAGLLPLRAGLTVGPVTTIWRDGVDYLGTSVNRAAKLCAGASPWQVRVHSDVTRHGTVHYTLLPAR